MDERDVDWRQFGVQASRESGARPTLFDGIHHDGSGIESCHGRLRGIDGGKKILVDLIARPLEFKILVDSVFVPNDASRR